MPFKRKKPEVAPPVVEEKPEPKVAEPEPSIGFKLRSLLPELIECAYESQDVRYMKIVRAIEDVAPEAEG